MLERSDNVNEPYCHALLSGDFNNDLKADLVVVNYGSSNLSFLAGAGNGTFAAAANTGVGGLPYAVAAADVNADGKLDAIIANSGGNSISVLRGNANGTFAASTISVDVNPQSLALADA